MDGNGEVKMTENVYKAPEFSGAKIRHRMRACDVRTPVTLEEAQAALDLAEAALDGIEASAPPDDPELVRRFDGARSAWVQKHAEILYMIERLKAGEAPASSRTEVEKLQRRVTELENQIARGDRAENGRVSALEHELVQAREKNERLAAQVREARQMANGSAPTGDSVKAALKKTAHDTMAFGAEAMDELIASGVRLTPLARLFRVSCLESMPLGHREKWRAKDLAFKQTAAEAQPEDE